MPRLSARLLQACGSRYARMEGHGPSVLKRGPLRWGRLRRVGALASCPSRLAQLWAPETRRSTCSIRLRISAPLNPQTLLMPA